MVVINSSPIIALAKINKLELLRNLFGKVSLTEQVYKEIMSKPAYAEAIAIKKAVGNDKWIKVHKIIEIKSTLGVGEASSISLALKLNEPLIIDDKKAAFVASTLGIKCHGTLYVILLALKRKIIKDKKETIEIVNQLIENKLYLSSDTLAEFYALVNKISIVNQQSK